MFASVHHPWYPTYGYGWTTPSNSTFGFTLMSGHIPDPGSADFNPTPPNGYKSTEVLLGAAGMPPFTKDVWHDFYYHAIYNAKPTSPNGVLEVWHREQGGAFQKVYSNKNDGTALINRAPHPTWFYNDANGTPDQRNIFATKSLYRVYREANASQTNHDVIYWMDGCFRRQSQQAIINEFAAMDSPNAPTISSFAPTSGTAGVTNVDIYGTNFLGSTLVQFNGVSASFGIVLDTHITTQVPVGATTGRIQVTNPSGTGTSAVDFTVGATPPPSLPNPAANHLRVGKSDTGSSLSGLVPDYKRVIKRSVGPVSITIDKAYAWIQGANATHRVVVYDDDGVGGAPGTRLGFSDPSSALAAGSWVAFNFTTPVPAVGDSIYIGLHEGTSTDLIGIETIPNGMWFIADTYADGPSNPFGSSYSTANIEFSLVVDYTVTGDARAPVFLSAQINSSTLSMLYDETLDPASTPSISAFAVTVNQQPWLPSSVGVSGSQVQLVGDTLVGFSDIVTVAYTQPGSNALQDVFGNKCVSLAAQSVSNQTQPLPGARIIAPAKRVAIARRIDPSDSRAGEGGGL